MRRAKPLRLPEQVKINLLQVNFCNARFCRNPYLPVAKTSAT